MDLGKLAAIVAAVAGITSWWLTNYAERVLSAPTLAFEVHDIEAEGTGPCKGFRQHELVLENLSMSARLPTFTTIIRVTGGGVPFAGQEQAGCFSRVDPIGVGELTAPSMSVFDSQILLELSQGVVAGAAFSVPFYSKGELTGAPVVTFSARGDVRILERGFETWVLRNEFGILICLSVFLILGGGLVLYFGRKDS